MYVYACVSGYKDKSLCCAGVRVTEFTCSCVWVCVRVGARVGARVCGCVSVCDCRDARVNGSGGSFECEENKSGHWPIGFVFLE